MARSEIGLERFLLHSVEERHGYAREKCTKLSIRYQNCIYAKSDGLSNTSTLRKEEVFTKGNRSQQNREH